MTKGDAVWVRLRGTLRAGPSLRGLAGTPIDASGAIVSSGDHEVTLDPDGLQVRAVQEPPKQRRRTPAGRRPVRLLINA